MQIFFLKPGQTHQNFKKTKTILLGLQDPVGLFLSTRGRRFLKPPTSLSDVTEIFHSYFLTALWIILYISEIQTHRTIKNFFIVRCI